MIGKGLKAYGSFVVKNSSWLRELQSVDAAHPQHDPERWRKSQHYLLCFKDRMFEAIAQEVQTLYSPTSVCRQRPLLKGIRGAGEIYWTIWQKRFRADGSALRS